MRPQAVSKIVEGQSPEVRDEPVDHSIARDFSKGKLPLAGRRLDNIWADVVHVPVLNQRPEELIEVQHLRDAHRTVGAWVAGNWKRVHSLEMLLVLAQKASQGSVRAFCSLTDLQEKEQSSIQNGRQNYIPPRDADQAANDNEAYCNDGQPYQHWDSEENGAEGFDHEQRLQCSDGGFADLCQGKSQLREQLELCRGQPSHVEEGILGTVVQPRDFRILQPHLHKPGTKVMAALRREDHGFIDHRPGYVSDRPPHPGKKDQNLEEHQSLDREGGCTHHEDPVNDAVRTAGIGSGKHRAGRASSPRKPAHGARRAGSTARAAIIRARARITQEALGLAWSGLVEALVTPLA